MFFLVFSWATQLLCRLSLYHTAACCRIRKRIQIVYLNYEYVTYLIKQYFLSYDSPRCLQSSDDAKVDTVTGTRGSTATGTAVVAAATCHVRRHPAALRTRQSPRHRRHKPAATTARLPHLRHVNSRNWHQSHSEHSAGLSCPSWPMSAVPMSSPHRPHNPPPWTLQSSGRLMSVLEVLLNR